MTRVIHLVAVQVLEDAPFTTLKPILESLIVSKDQDKQRAAAELLAGIIGGESYAMPLERLTNF